MSLKCMFFLTHKTRTRQNIFGVFRLQLGVQGSIIYSFFNFLCNGECVTVSFSNTGQGAGPHVFWKFIHSSKVICFCCLVLGERRETLKWLVFWLVSFRGVGNDSYCLELAFRGITSICFPMRILVIDHKIHGLPAQSFVYF